MTAFSPSDLFAEGEQGGWYDCTDLSSMFQDVAGTIPAVVGSSVALIKDKSGRGNDLTQSVSSSCPILQQDINAQYYLQFDGVDDRLTNVSTNFEFVNSFASCGLFNVVSSASFLGYAGVYSGAASGWDNGFQSGVPRDAVRGTSSIDSGFSGFSSVAGTNAVVTVENTLTSVTRGVNGTRVTTSGTWTPVTSASSFVFGNRQDIDSGSYQGAIYGLTVLGRALTSTERAELEAWYESRNLNLPIRGSSIASFNGSSGALSFPAGCIVGDVAVLFFGGGYGADTPPTGWALVTNADGSNWNGAVYIRQLSQADIDAGTVTITPAGSYFFVAAMAVFEGSINYPIVFTSLRNGSGSVSVDLEASADTLAGDLVLLFGSARATANVTASNGSVLQSINSNTASATLNAYTVEADGAFNTTFGYSTAGSGNYQVAINIRDTGGVASVSRLTQGAAVALSESRAQATRLTQGAAVALSESRAQATRLTIGVLVDVTQRDYSQAMLGLGAWGF